MRNKKFVFDIRGTRYEVEAEVDGQCRYMERMRQPDATNHPAAPTRIGYLTGRDRHWVVEFGTSQAGVPAPSAKEACRHLLERAIMALNNCIPAPAATIGLRHALTRCSA